MRHWPLLLLVAACSSSSPAAEPSPPLVTSGADAGPPLPALGMNDVSVLVPVPASPKTVGPLRPRDAGEKGELLPQKVYDEIPKFGVEPAEGLEYARMRVVAIRFDGCFPGKAGCEAQIRLVMQPITDQGATLDSAIHLFYALTEAELAEVVVGLRHLRTLAPEVQDAPLDVHAALVAQGIEGPYATGLRDLVLRFAGDENLVRMTFFLRAPPRQEEWFFGGFDRVGGVLQRMNIVGVGKGNQRVDRPATAAGFTYVFTPAGKTPEDISVLLSTETSKAASPDALAKAHAAVARIENPNKHGPDALPCAGCHVTTVLAAHAKESAGVDVTKLPDAFASTRDLTVRGEAAKTPSSLRAFGWFGKAPMIGVRVVNETAAVVDDLESRFPAAK